MGPNGAGKTTLLKLLAGSEKPTAGQILLHGKNMHDYHAMQLAKLRAVLSQQYALQFPVAVAEVVMMGRYPHFQGAPSAHDAQVCRTALADMQMEAFAQRDYLTPSGGEQQKVQMSRVMAQLEGADNKQPRILFLDEPVSHLDVKYQHLLMQKAKQWCIGVNGVLAVLHDINLALQFADTIYFMKNGRLSGK